MSLPQHHLPDSPVDLLIIGGGIVGAGVARDAAMRGLSVVLVEQHDLASGTSSRSSRLLHGGLRYLAQGRIGLVRQASREKRVLANIAGHLAQPLGFVFPTYKASGWPKWKLRIGVKIYDLLCTGGNFGSSSSMNASRMQAYLPGINPLNLTGGVRYFDGMTNDARLVIDTLKSAATHGAFVHNYTRFIDAQRHDKHWVCRVARGDEEAEVSASVIINASGPWADRFAQGRVKLRPTKGVHLVIDRQRLPVPDAVVMTNDNRLLFAIPWGERVILGTTDTDYDGPLDNPQCDVSDMQAVLDQVNALFPDASIQASDVVSTWAGLRPLLANWRGDPSDIARSHLVQRAESGWIDAAGGKLTTYRLMAEEAVDLAIKEMGLSPLKCRTATEPLIYDHGWSGILPPPVSLEVANDCVESEWCTTLTDLMIRRTSWHYYHDDRLDIAHRAASWMAAKLNWTNTAMDQQYREYARLVED